MCVILAWVRVRECVWVRVRACTQVQVCVSVDERGGKERKKDLVCWSIRKTRGNGLCGCVWQCKAVALLDWIQQDTEWVLECECVLAGARAWMNVINVPLKGALLPILNINAKRVSSQVALWQWDSATEPANQPFRRNTWHFENGTPGFWSPVQRCRCKSE